MAISSYEKVAGISDSDYRFAETECHRFVQDDLDLPDLPEQGDNLSTEGYNRLLQKFIGRVKGSGSSGDVAISFSKLIKYIVGNSSQLSLLQRKAILAACSIVEERPLPTLRWSIFVLSNLDKVEWIRAILTACLLSKRELWKNIVAGVQRDYASLQLPTNPTILAVGHSLTAVAVIQGVRAAATGRTTVITPLIHLQGRPFSENELIVHELEKSGWTIGDEVIVQEETAAEELCIEGRVDLIVMGCKVIGRTLDGSVEIVNSYPAVAFVERTRSDNLPVMVAAGLYKIWPSQFYSRHKASAVEQQKVDHTPVNGVLPADAVDWVALEHGVIPTREFADHPRLQPFLDLESLARGAALMSREATKKLDKSDIMLIMSKEWDGLDGEDPLRPPQSQSTGRQKSVGDRLINILIRPLLHERAGYRAGRPINLLGPRVKLLSPEDVIAIAQGTYRPSKNLKNSTESSSE